jgi:hypothetical protein
MRLCVKLIVSFLRSFLITIYVLYSPFVLMTNRSLFSCMNSVYSVFYYTFAFIVCILFAPMLFVVNSSYRTAVCVAFMCVNLGSM